MLPVSYNVRPGFVQFAQIRRLEQVVNHQDENGIALAHFAATYELTGHDALQYRDISVQIPGLRAEKSILEILAEFRNGYLSDCQLLKGMRAFSADDIEKPKYKSPNLAQVELMLRFLGAIAKSANPAISLNPQVCTGLSQALALRSNRNKFVHPGNRTIH